MNNKEAIQMIRDTMLNVAKSPVSVASFEKFQEGCFAVIDELTEGVEDDANT